VGWGQLEFGPDNGGMMVEVLKVSSKSNPNAVAGALAGVLRQAGMVEVQVVGAGALNQAIKAIAIARGFVAPSNIDLVCIPTFADIEIDGESRTAIRLAVEDRARRLGPDDQATTTVAARGSYRPIYNGTHATPDLIGT
jgi:stage V sporulation protein S